MTVPWVLGGTNGPFDRTFRNCSSTAACAAGEIVVRSASVSRWRANGGGASGNGCVGQAASPFEIGRRDGPLFDREERRALLAIEHEDVARLGHLRDGVHRRPLRCTVTSTGAAGGSRSQMS